MIRAVPSAFSEAIQAGPFALEAVDLSPEDPAAMIYTSGLTGRPLGAVLTQQNLLMQSDLMRIVIHGSENERVLCLIPLFHSFGAAVNMLNVVSLGGAIIMVNQFNLDSILKTVEREKITVIASVPRLFLGMLFHEGADKYDLSSIRLCVTGGAAIDPNLIPEFQKRFKVMIMEGYGLTEAAPVCAFGRLDMVQKPGSIGIHVPGVELKIFAQNGKELPPGEIGELVVKGINVMKGYYKDEAATAAVIKDGWLHTGDLALMDADGYVFLKGLKKRMVITSGFNVYPREVEMILEEHPAVEKARVAGKADLMRGEIVKAFVVQKTDALVDDKALMKHCRTYLSSYKVPREIEFVEKI